MSLRAQRMCCQTLLPVTVTRLRRYSPPDWAEMDLLRVPPANPETAAAARGKLAQKRQKQDGRQAPWREDLREETVP